MHKFLKSKQVESNSYYIVRGKKEGQDLSGQCLKETNGKFAFSKKDQKRVWKEHMEKTMNKEKAQKTEVGIVEGPVKKVSLEEITSAIKK